MTDETPRDTSNTKANGEYNDSTRPMPNNESIERVLGLDDVFEALSPSRSRYLLYTLGNEGDETLSELSTKIAAWEEDKPVSDVTDEERKSVQISLYHAHVPRLAELNILDYEEGDDIIVKAQNTEQVMTVLNGAGAELDSRQESHAHDQNDE